MVEIYRTKVFKSGNSVALRLPKALEVAEGTEMEIVREAPMSFRFQPVEAPRKTIDVSGFWGKAPGLELAPREDFEERPSTIVKREAAAREALGKA
jgi:antitoxin VapB